MAIALKFNLKSNLIKNAGIYLEKVNEEYVYNL